MTVLVLFAIDVQYFEPISHYFVTEAVPQGHGRNIVNVILVDFRALDTLGEIFVLALAAIGVYSMINLRAETRR
jgi:multicomponent Na+:H+ antiporter subunit A